MKKPIRKELLDELLAEYANPEDLTGPEGLLKRLTGALVERALQAEMTDHLGYEPGPPRVRVVATRATALAKRRSGLSKAKSPSRCLAIVTARSSPS